MLFFPVRINVCGDAEQFSANCDRSYKSAKCWLLAPSAQQYLPQKADFIWTLLQTILYPKTWELCAAAGLHRTSASGLQSFWEILSSDGTRDVGAFQGKKIQLICMTSRIGWPAALLRPHALFVLTSVLSGTLQSAVTFTVTSQHALCLPRDRAPVCCPWVWLTTLYLGRKGCVPCRFFTSGCTLFSCVILSVSVFA